MCLFKNYYMPTLTYGAETRAQEKTDISILTTTEMTLLRSAKEKMRENY